MKKQSEIIELSEMQIINNIIAQAGRKITTEHQSTMIGFRVDNETLNRLKRLTNGLGKKRITILRAALLAFESLSVNDKAKFLIKVMK